ncbi:MAG TPA: 5-formyltetrahydrofolate cyclo-ligase [Polyangiaceae bacterium LLY-WYZ-15_(1-7)]|nr:5-formyltetrahydrofolate cyclo-ligase [Myxococcales bacterium]MAT26135.1 5-formyltetrahydrofolate cyclo-ligase [Sandaracinus sp.]HJK90210.1 5-formyltetrahydrofolate cyclo-ligase [Polyangiaceae bacterium LLY-WYZ-15_(1-7)]HJL00492.1 5-formyltetrahydrofolate cyclo-ligase [Polyangiaceae bacterium LLY-WYZ-15_(1-7)]HJL10718.1 5-formyltetrahydrofolate cyclo-ligase [Polyangiaceae bacterium LLY-WYZ-15_(1-7)]
MSAPTKAALREAGWQAIRDAGAKRFPGVEGRIPNFVGAEAAATRLSQTPEWEAAEALKCNPDAPQRPVRHAALKAGKRVYMAVPRLRETKPFLLLDPARLDDPWRASSIRGAGEVGVPVGLEEVEPLALIVTGCVVIGARGERVGKGGGYSDLEWGVLADAGKVGEGTVIASTAHACQRVEAAPREAWDIALDLLATPEALHRFARLPRPPGILWDALDPERRAAIPVLAERAP